jgi:hypothetical protein
LAHPGQILNDQYGRLVGLVVRRLMDERARRVGLNEAVFRAVNDEVHGLNDRFTVLGDPMSVVCECGRADCTERLELSAADYERMRRDPTHFAIKPGHEAPDVEDVIERNDGYWLVEKQPGGPAELARKTDVTD